MTGPASAAWSAPAANAPAAARAKSSTRLRGTTLAHGSVDRDGTIAQGGYSTHIVVDQDFVLAIPDGVGLAEAAPLLCAGITTWWPLRHHGAGPGKKVAVIGLGRLGHLAVKLACAMGAEVTVLSQSLNKRDDCLRLGASCCYATSDPETFEKLAGTYDLIVNTVSVPCSWSSSRRSSRSRALTGRSMVSRGRTCTPATGRPTARPAVRPPGRRGDAGAVRPGPGPRSHPP